jgi:Crinkler effector protein N-terminal domain
MLPRTLELNCLVLGDDPSHLFTVKISDTEYVSILKDEIWKKKKNAFNGVDANTLVLWEVSFPFGDNIQQILDKFKPVKELALRRPASRLSSVFHYLPKDEHIHILIRHPCECTYLYPRLDEVLIFPLCLPYPFATVFPF